jgi:hypothetical protein
MTEPMRLCTWTCVTWWATKGIKGLHYDPIRVRHSLKVITIWKRQTKQVIVIRSRRIHLRWYWIPTFLLQVKMHLWVDVYIMMHSHDIVMHMLRCNATCNDVMHTFCSTISINTWFMTSTFSGLSKNARIMENTIGKIYLKKQINNFSYDRDTGGALRLIAQQWYRRYKSIRHRGNLSKEWIESLTF